MVDVDHFTYGFFNPIFAEVVSILGCLLGLILAAKAQGRRSSVRHRLQIYATLAVSVSGVWVPQLVALLGFTIRPAAVRYAPETLAVSLVTPVLLLGAGLWVTCLPTARRWRLLVAAPLVAGGLAAASYATMLSMRIGGTITYDPTTSLASTAGELAVAAILVWAAMTVRSLLVAVGAAVLIGSMLTGTVYLAMDGIRVHMSATHPPFVGLTALQLLAPAVSLSACLLAMLWFFTVGASTRHDLQAVFESPEHSIEIEPWLIEEVSTRVGEDIIRTDADADVAGSPPPIPVGRRQGSPHQTPPPPPRTPPTATTATATTATTATATATATAWRSGPMVGPGRARPLGTINGRARPGRPGTTGNLRLDIAWQQAAPKATRRLLAAASGEVASQLDRYPPEVVATTAAALRATRTANSARAASAEVADERSTPAHQRSRWRNRRS